MSGILACSAVAIRGRIRGNSHTSVQRQTLSVGALLDLASNKIECLDAIGAFVNRRNATVAQRWAAPVSSMNPMLCLEFLVGDVLL
jgi:hypothetical protein